MPFLLEEHPIAIPIEIHWNRGNLIGKPIFRESHVTNLIQFDSWGHCCSWSELSSAYTHGCLMEQVLCSYNSTKSSRSFEVQFHVLSIPSSNKVRYMILCSLKTRNWWPSSTAQSCNLIFKTEISVVFGKSKCHTHKGEQIVGNLHASYARQCGRECQVAFFQVWGVERPVRNGEIFAVSVNLCPHGIEILIGKLEHENHEIYLSQGEASCCPASMQLGSFFFKPGRRTFPGHVPQSQKDQG